MLYIKYSRPMATNSILCSHSSIVLKIVLSCSSFLVLPKAVCPAYSGLQQDLCLPCAFLLFLSSCSFQDPGLQLPLTCLCSILDPSHDSGSHSYHLYPSFFPPFKNPATFPNWVTSALKMDAVYFCKGECGVTVGWHTVLQGRRLGVQFPMVTGFFVNIIRPATIWPWGQLSL